jgi:hypothetical protein
MPTASVLTLDPAIQKLLDDMLAITGDTYRSLTCSTNLDASGTNQSVSLIDKTGPSGNQQTYTTRTVGVTVTISPVGASAGPGETVQFIATATNPDGTPVSSPAFKWSLLPGALGTISAAGLYMAPAVIPQNAADMVQCDCGNSWANTSVSLHP